MPRGYLKSCQGVSRRVSRGGSSRKTGKQTRTGSSKSHDHIRRRTRLQSYITDEVESGLASYCREEFDDCNVDSEYHMAEESNETSLFDTSVKRHLTSKTKHKDANNSGSLKRCVVCLCEKPPVHLTHSCRANHVDEAACYECFRQLYVHQAQQDVANFPLRCFHPSCRIVLDDTVLRTHGILQGSTEWSKHYRLGVLAKAYRRRGGGAHGGPSSSKVTHCPQCDHPHLHGVRNVAVSKNKHTVQRPPSSRTKRVGSEARMVVHKQKGGDDGVSRPYDQRRFTCRQCHHVFTPPDEPAKNANSNMIFVDNGGVVTPIPTVGRDRAGGDDGWAPCPSCHMLINKGDGCDHIACPCGRHFYWFDAKTIVKTVSSTRR